MGLVHEEGHDERLEHQNREHVNDPHDHEQSELGAPHGFAVKCFRNGEPAIESGVQLPGKDIARGGGILPHGFWILLEPGARLWQQPNLLSRALPVLIDIQAIQFREWRFELEHLRDE